MRTPAARAVLLFVAAAAAMVAFNWQDGLATFGDDGASYLALAHFFAGSGGSRLVAEWAPYQAHFPPLFPLLLAWSGAIRDLHVAYAMVALCGAAGAVAFYRFAANELGEAAGWTAALLFVLAPTAWISLKGVLSESLFMLLCMASLLAHARLCASRSGALQWLGLGLLIACAALTRAIGIILLAAYLLWLLRLLVMEKRGPALRELVVLVPAAVLLGSWYALRPQPPVDSYRVAASWVAGSWLQSPGDTFVGAARTFLAGWMRSFMADHDAPRAAWIVYGAFAVLAIAGAASRARRGRLDGIFLVLYALTVFAWPFSADTTRRLLYPAIPLAILCIVHVVRGMVERAPWSAPARKLVVVAATALPLLLTAPALAMIAQRSLDTRAVIEGCPQRHREISDYFGTASLEDAEKLAVLEVTILCGLQSLERVTAPASTIMWSRPEYVALLGHRRAVPYFNRESAAELSDHIAQDAADYVIVTQINKTDLEGNARPSGALESLRGEPVFQLSDGIFALYPASAARR